jgi:hypothetical protein
MAAKKITEIGIIPWVFFCWLRVWRVSISAAFVGLRGGGRLWYFRDCLVWLVGEGDRSISVIVGCVGCCSEGRW